MGFFKELFGAIIKGFEPKKFRKSDLLMKELAVWLEEDIVNDRIRKAEEEFDKEMAEARAKGDVRLEILARKKLSKAYEESGFKNLEKKKKELIEERFNLL